MPADFESVVVLATGLAAPLIQLMCITSRIRRVETVAGRAKCSLAVKSRRSGRAARFMWGIGTGLTREAAESRNATPAKPELTTSQTWKVPPRRSIRSLDLLAAIELTPISGQLTQIDCQLARTDQR